MQYVLIHNIRILSQFSVLALSVLFLAPSSALADSRFGNSDRYTHIHDIHKVDAPILPTRMMNNEQLFISAQTRKNVVMTPFDLRANHFWLQSHRGEGYEGTAALRKFLSMTFLNMYPSLEYKSEVESENKNKNPKKEEIRAFQDINNYSLRVSQRKAILKFKYKF
jgi:hypothetical protein